MDGSNKLIQKDSWQSLLGNNEEVITTHEVNGDDWTMVSKSFHQFLYVKIWWKFLEKKSDFFE